ncbi:MAG: hypothetical protein JWO38_5030 [Gemmataceae bacterium]|nr:hypothetical protein [Gemmataceae bacterium]
MNRSAKRQHHEQARKRHRHEQEQHAREVAKKPRASFPAFFLVAGVAIMLLVVLGVAFLS